MAAVINRGSTPKLLWEGLNTIWGIAYKNYTPQWKKLFEIANSQKAYEEDVGLVGMGLAPQKPEGESLKYDTMKQGVVSRYTNITYALGYVITREEFEDVLYPQFGTDRTIALARSMHQTKENVGANIFNRGFNGSFVGGDGVSLFSTSHPTEGGNLSNRPAVDTDISENSLEQGAIDIADFRDNRQNRIEVRPRKVAVPIQSMFQIKRILGNPLRPATSDRDINALFADGTYPEGFTVNNYFSDSDAWFILTDCPKGLRHFVRIEAQFEDDNDFDTKNGKFSGYERYTFGWTDWRGAYGSEGN